MHVTMVKKRLANGEPCRKCAQAEELLRARGLWDRVDEVLWADEADPQSPGMRLGAHFGMMLAPFFIVRDGDGTETAYDSVIAFIRRITDGPTVPPPAAETPSFDALEEKDVVATAAQLSERHPSQILRWGLERWGRQLSIAFSGAEDVVLIHMASETQLPFSAFCLDTGRLHPETYRFIDRVRKRYKVDVALMAPETEALQSFVKRKGLFSFYEDGHGECCGIRKVEPLRRALHGLSAWVTGQRRDQSPATRSDVAVLERDAKNASAGRPLFKLNPLARWSSAQTWQYIRDEGIEYNELHSRGFVSIGCEPCTRAVLPGEHERAGRWWWEESTKRECGLHLPDRESGTKEK